MDEVAPHAAGPAGASVDLDTAEPGETMTAAPGPALEVLKAKWGGWYRITYDSDGREYQAAKDGEPEAILTSATPGGMDRKPAGVSGASPIPPQRLVIIALVLGPQFAWGPQAEIDKCLGELLTADDAETPVEFTAGTPCAVYRNRLAMCAADHHDLLGSVRFRAASAVRDDGLTVGAQLLGAAV
jgi:hypothetical protein